MNDNEISDEISDEQINRKCQQLMNFGSFFRPVNVMDKAQELLDAVEAEGWNWKLCRVPPDDPYCVFWGKGNWKMGQFTASAKTRSRAITLCYLKLKWGEYEQGREMQRAGAAG